jgi:hypothetical protein
MMDKKERRSFGPRLHRVGSKRGLGTLLLLMAIVFAFHFSACMDMRFQMGKKTNPEVLEKALRPGVSNSKDVLAALGEPFGKGMAMLPITHETPRTMWTYYYGEADMKDGRGMYLFVFLDRDLYDGYMWFSSLQRRGTSQPK